MFISLECGIWKVFVGELHLFEEIWYVKMTTDRERTLQLMTCTCTSDVHLYVQFKTTISMDNEEQPAPVGALLEARVRTLAHTSGSYIEQPK